MDSQLRTGELLADRYELRERLGVGATGEVYRAADRLLGNADVAVKILFRSLLASEAAVARFRNEAAVTRELTHPGIVQVFDFGRTADGSYFLVMEFVEGGTLRELLQSHPEGVGTERALDLFGQLADAMGVAHRFGIVHRDLKPENILIDSTGRARISDFGVAADVERLSALTVSGDVIGTVDYMAPEQLSGAGADTRADVFALGLIVYELLTGALPWRSPNEELLNRYSARRELVTEVSGELPLMVLNIIDRALEIEPRRRWSNAETLSAAITQWREQRAMGWLHRVVHSRVRIAHARRILRRILTTGGIAFAVYVFVVLADRQQLVRTTGLMIFERFTGISTRSLTEILGVHAEYSEEGLLRCVSEGNETCMRSLLYAGLDPNITDANGSPLIVILSRQLPYFAMNTLLPRGADINSVDRKGRSPMLMLLTSPSGAAREVIVHYLELKPDLRQLDWRGRGALWYTAAIGRSDVWDLMLAEFRERYGEEELRKELNRRDVDGLPLIHILVGVGARGAPEGFLERALEAARGLFDLNASGPDGLTPLMRARQVPWQQVWLRHNALIAAGADPELVVDGKKLPPLPTAPTPHLEKEGWEFFRRESRSLYPD